MGGESQNVVNFAHYFPSPPCENLFLPIQKSECETLKRMAMDNTNCPYTGASITIVCKRLMKKMVLTNVNLHRDNTRVSAMEGSTIKVLGFIPLSLKVKDNMGQVH